MVSASARHSSFLEAYFGPPSDPIEISQFLDAHTELPSLEEVSAEEDFQVEDIKNPVKNIWDNPRLSAYLIQQHDLAMDAFYRSTKPAAKKRKTADLTPPTEPCVELKDLKACLEDVGISSYRFPSETAFFTRSTKLSDQNALTKIKHSSPCDNVDDPDKKALILVSIYSKLPVGYGKTSQHVFLSSQTLGDLLGAFACTSNDLPIESAMPQGGVTYKHPEDASSSTGAAVVVEGVLYGDESDYAEKVFGYLEKKNKLPSGLTKSAKFINNVSFESLSLRTQEPYWILHQGDCEHYAVIDQIRLRHSSDPVSGYPLTVQITPLPIDVCRGCCKISAVWSIVGDERLGESPCLLCGPCWKNMGDPPPETDVTVVPLPRYQVGWV